MNILCIGDVVGQKGIDYLAKKLPELKIKMQADVVIVNGENSDTSGVGLSKGSATEILQYADVITTGNHCYRRAGEELYLENETVLHPANQPFTDDNTGCCMLDMGRYGYLRVINLAGTAWMETLDNPFITIDRLLAKQECRFTIVDFHAESTAEKKAMGFYLDGRVSALFGTHTHVQTADEQILPKGTGYITDAGMTGPSMGVLGVEPALAIKRQKEHVPVRFQVAEGDCMMNAVLFELDNTTGMCQNVQRILI